MLTEPDVEVADTPPRRCLSWELDVERGRRVLTALCTEEDHLIAHPKLARAGELADIRALQVELAVLVYDAELGAELAGQ
jgi:hypothetical protein